MGEVWKARDMRLQRDVAVKVLPQAFATDADRIRRFQQEARAVASLNHPNICQIHDVGPDYIVLEYVEGSPLCGLFLMPMHVVSRCRWPAPSRRRTSAASCIVT
jgi:eukaryotic-like serine/threonine-protein kinase